MSITTRSGGMKITRRLASLSLATCLLGVAEFSAQTTKEAQPVTMQIEYRGGQEMHLHLKKDTVLRFSRKHPVTWNVHILPIKEKEPIPRDLRPKEVTLWFPLPVLKDSKEPGQVFLREITFRDFDYSEPDNIGRARRELTPNPEFQLVGNEITAIPLAIYTDIDEGQDPVNKRPGNRKGKFKQPGLQMVDGANSNPQCEVGP